MKNATLRSDFYSDPNLNVFSFYQSKLDFWKVCVLEFLFRFFGHQIIIFFLWPQIEANGFFHKWSLINVIGRFNRSNVVSQAPKVPKLSDIIHLLFSWTHSCRRESWKKRETEGGCVSILCIADWKAHRHEIVLQHFWEKCQCFQLWPFLGRVATIDI